MHVSNLYEAIGGAPACRQLAIAFYARVKQDPVLSPLFPGKSLRCAIEEFTAFLAQFLGGPSTDSQRRWWLSIRESHQRFKIGQRERDAWLANMAPALADCQIEEPARSELADFFARSSAYVVNHGVNDGVNDGVNQGEAPPHRHRPIGVHGESMRQEISRRWDAQIGLDKAVAAIRRGDANCAIAVVEAPALKACGRSVHSGLFSLMVRGGQPALLEYVRARLTSDPAFTHERYAGRTLLHEAAAAGNVNMVGLLLSLGANPNAPDGGEHTPLYSLSNECAAPGGPDVVRALVQAGADVDAKDGAKHCTALHMAARRGNVEVAEALLDCGSDIESRDSLGDTPLRRSVNCNKTEVATLLLARGADIHSIGSKGITPQPAARTITMKRLLLSAVGGALPG